MAFPQSYEDAADWFRAGKVGFDELLAIVRQLPAPDPYIEDPDDPYNEKGPGPNSVEWLAYLLPAGLIDKEQALQLAGAVSS
jgi:hypothetical protein